MITLENYIDGKLVSPAGEKYFDSVNPSNTLGFAKVPDSSKEDAENALLAAENAFESWSKTSIEKRSKILMKIADLIERDLDELAEIESKDNGKPLWLCKKVDIPRAAVNFRFFANAITQFHSETYEVPGVGFNYTLRKPLGAVVCISPWNLPLYLFTWKIAPALAAGNTVVGKPSEVTPASAYYLSKLCIEAGLPRGVLNIVHGRGAEIGDALVSNERTKAVSFTGGTVTGKIIAKKCAEKLIPCSLELGGKNPALVFEDCDLENTIDKLVKSSFTNQGQICLCSSRILIEESIYRKFKSKFIEKVSELRVGPPHVEGVNLGAIVSKEHFEKILSFISSAKEQGANILTGGNSCSPECRREDEQYSKGFYIEPTVIEGLDNSCNVNQEEIFGPVVSLQAFKTFDEAIKLANDNKYGLSATIWTTNLKTAHRAANDVEAGIVWVNSWLERDLRTPFGGMKQSGLGREGGFEALQFFTEPKNIYIEY